MRVEPERYAAAVRDWVEHGAESRFALDARRGGGALGAAAARGSRGGRLASSSASTCIVPATPRTPCAWFREAHRLQPDNWTYKRQAWSSSTRSCRARASSTRATG